MRRLSRVVNGFPIALSLTVHMLVPMTFFKVAGTVVVHVVGVARQAFAFNVWNT
jgi:hypothetical protein